MSWQNAAPLLLGNFEMLVKELIKRLQTLPQDMTIVLRGEYHNGGPKAEPIDIITQWNSAVNPENRRLIVYAGTGTYPNDVEEYLEHNPDHRMVDDLIVIE